MSISGSQLSCATLKQVYSFVLPMSSGRALEVQYFKWTSFQLQSSGNEVFRQVSEIILEAQRIQSLQS